jgi:hypothetical protein
MLREVIDMGHLRLRDDASALCCPRRWCLERRTPFIAPYDSALSVFARTHSSEGLKPANNKCA